jgi:glycine betaine/proline transport system substrate-binding protein
LVSAIWFIFDVVMLNEPPYDPAKYIMVQPADDPDWYAKSTVATKDSIKNVQIAWSNSLADRSPTIAEFFANFSLTAADVSRMAYEMTANGRAPEDAAKEWIAANSERVDKMLGL